MKPVSRPRRPSRLRLVRAAAALSLLVLSVVPHAATADDAETRLSDARAQLEAIEAQLRAQKQQADALAQHLVALQGYEDQGQVAYEQLTAKLRETRGQMADAHARVADLHAQSDMILRNAYKDGPAAQIEALFGATSEELLGERLNLLAQITEGNAALVQEASAVSQALATENEQTQLLVDQQQAALQQLDQQRRQVEQQAAQVRAAEERLAATRGKAFDLVVKYKSMISVGDLAGLIDALQGQNNINYGDWAGAFLAALGAPGCRDNLVVMVAWQMSEGTDARFNPLATTYDMPGATTFNYAGVKNYASLEDGLRASVETLQRGSSSYGYKDIIRGLRACAPAETTAEAIAASSWCGCGDWYVTSLIERVAKDYNQYAKL